MENLDFSAFFTTRKQCADFAQKIGEVVDAMYVTNFSLEKTLTEKLGIAKKDALLQLFEENHIASGAIGDFLKKIQEKITNLPTVNLTIAFEPTDETLRKLSQWFIMNLKKNVVFEIFVDSSLAGGAVVDYNGKSKDFSLRERFATFLPGDKTTQAATPSPMQNQHTATQQ